MILAFCFAALARDVGNSLVISPDHILPERDDHRKLAVAKLDMELAALSRYVQCLCNRIIVLLLPMQFLLQKAGL